MANIVELRDSANVKSYPVTKAEAVYTDSGRTVEADIDRLSNYIDDYLNGVHEIFTVPEDGYNYYPVLLLKGAVYVITNNTNASAYIKAYRADGTGTATATTIAKNATARWTCDDDDYITLGGYFDGTGTITVTCEYKNFDRVTPEMFGAKGNGTTNDKVSLQAAVNSCINKGVPLYLTPGATYAIGDSITIQDPTAGFRIFGNGATIKALSGYSLTTWKGLLSLDQDNANTSTTVMNYFTDIILDCSEVCSGVHVDYGFHFIFRNILINNVRGAGIHVGDGGECYFNNIHINCIHNSSVSSVGLEVLNSDYHFTDVVIIDADRAITNSSSSMYTRVHAWNRSGCTGTTFFIHNSGYPILVQCHADTYETAYYRETDNYLLLIGCVYYINTNLYDSSTTPVIFKFTESSVAYSGNVKCVDCVFDSLRTTVDMAWATHRIQLINCVKKGTINRFENGVALSLSNGVLDTGLTVNRNRLTQDGDKVRVELVVDISSITFSNNTTAKTIGSIPVPRLYPNAFFVYPVLFTTDDWSTDYVSGYISINNSNGLVQVCPKAAGTYKKLVVDCYFDKPLTLYEG